MNDFDKPERKEAWHVACGFQNQDQTFALSAKKLGLLTKFINFISDWIKNYVFRDHEKYVNCGRTFTNKANVPALQHNKAVALTLFIDVYLGYNSP